jgi:hypothetical protein
MIVISSRREDSLLIEDGLHGDTRCEVYPLSMARIASYSLPRVIPVCFPGKSPFPGS